MHAMRYLDAHVVAKKTAISFVEGVKGETRHFTRHKVA